jgi:hypothetical protein
MGPVRAPPTPPLNSSRRLVVHPQRAASCFIFMLIATALVGALVFAVGTGRIAPLGDIFALLALLAFACLFGVFGAHGWFLRVEFLIEGSDKLTMTWRRWPLADRRRSLPPRAIRDVIVEADDGCARIALVCRGVTIPLTESSTTDHLLGKARTIRIFIGLPEPQPVPVLARDAES